MNSAAGTYLEGMKAAFVAMASIPGVVAAHLVDAMRICDVSVADLDNHPALVALIERDRTTKNMIEEERKNLPPDYDQKRWE